MNSFLPNDCCLAKVSIPEAFVTRAVVILSTLPNDFYRVRDLEGGSILTLYAHNLMPTRNVPSRFSRHMFDGIAKVIGAALDAYPKAITVDPSPLSVETYARRFREAREAKRIYGYTHPSIDEEKFMLYADQLRTSMREGQLVIGTELAIRAVPIGNPVRVNEKPTDFVEVNLARLELLCSLLHDKALTPPPSFVVTCNDPGLLESIEQRYDVAFIPFEGETNKFQIL